MNGSRRRFLAGGASVLAGGVAGCTGNPPEVPPLDEAPGVGGGPMRFAYANGGPNVPGKPGTLLGRIGDVAEHEAHLAAEPFELLGHEPVSDAVTAAVDVESVQSYTKAAGARAFAGVDAQAVRETLAERGEKTVHDGVTVYAGEDWAASVTANAVVEAAAPLGSSTEARRQYVVAVDKARRGTGPRLLEEHRSSARVASVMPSCQYVSLTPELSAFDFESEGFGVDVRGERSVLATARLAAAGNEPSKRKTRLDVVDGWKRPLSPDADVSNVSVVKRGRIVRVTGTVPTETVTLDS